MALNNLPISSKARGCPRKLLVAGFQQGGRRERIVLATRVYQPMGPRPERSPAFCVSYSQSLRGRLRRLKTDHIDVYQMHHIDRHTPWEEIWQAMELLVQQGKVLYIGSSNFAGWDIATAQSIATAVISWAPGRRASLYNLTQPAPLSWRSFPHAAIWPGVDPWSPLAGGLLAAYWVASGRRARPAFAV